MSAIESEPGACLYGLRVLSLIQSLGAEMANSIHDLSALQNLTLQRGENIQQIRPENPTKFLGAWV
jgi:hypothetical protein